MKKTFLLILIALMLLFSHAISVATAMTTDTKGTLYDDAVFELEEKLALWENTGEATEVRELERMRDVFAHLSGSSAQYSKGFKQYIEVLSCISYKDYSSIDGKLYQIEKNNDFCDNLKSIHKQYIHIGTIEQLKNYTIGRKNQYYGEEATNKHEEYQYYQEAVSAYDRCNGWLDSTERYLDLIGIVNEYQRYYNMREGAIVTFGKYEQDNRTGALEPIEWIILEVNEATNSLTLLSRYLLDSQQYHTSANSRIAWGTSNIRNWLNNEFYNSAFSMQEKQAIIQQSVSNSWDYVFLLDEREITYRSLDKNGCEATRYAIDTRRVYVGKDNGLSPWWVRADNMEGSNGIFVGAHGKIYKNGNNPVTSKDNGIRPVIVIDMNRYLDLSTY